MDLLFCDLTPPGARHVHGEDLLPEIVGEEHHHVMAGQRTVAALPDLELELDGSFAQPPRTLPRKLYAVIIISLRWRTRAARAGGGQCSACLDRLANVLLFPCKHLATCEACLQAGRTPCPPSADRSEPYRTGEYQTAKNRRVGCIKRPMLYQTRLHLLHVVLKK